MSWVRQREKHLSHGYRRKPQKTRTIEQHADRNAQSENIAKLKVEYVDAGLETAQCPAPRTSEPALSVQESITLFLSSCSCPPALKWAPHGQPSEPLRLPFVANTQQVVSPVLWCAGVATKGNLDYVAGPGVVTLNQDWGEP